MTRSTNVYNIPNTFPTHVTRLLDVCDIITHKTNKYANRPSHKATNAQTHDHINALIHIHMHNHKETRTSSQSHRHTQYTGIPNTSTQRHKYANTETKKKKELHT